jgi:putative endopeptidase
MSMVLYFGRFAKNCPAMQPNARAGVAMVSGWRFSMIDRRVNFGHNGRDTYRYLYLPFGTFDETPMMLECPAFRSLVSIFLVSCGIASVIAGSAAGDAASGIDETCFDKSVRPQDDLFRAVNGRWLAETEIPADRSDYGSFAILADNVETDLREIVENCAAAEDSEADSECRQIGDLYASFMDEARIERLGIGPIAPRFATIDAINNKADLIATMAKLSKLGVAAPLSCTVGLDAKKSEQLILHVFQSGLGLPDRDYYFDEKFKAPFAAYRAYVRQMLTLAKVADAERATADIVALEARIAKAQWSKLENRDADKTYHKMDIAELTKLTPGFDWHLYFQSVGAIDVREVVVAQPSYLVSMSELLDAVPLKTWKIWLIINTLHRYASLLSKDLADAEFSFYGATLHDVPVNRPRWKRGVAVVENCLGEAVGKLYVEKRFLPEAKTRMDRMVANLLEAYRLSFRRLDWMSPATKEEALAKLATFTPKIGYPKKWRDYSSLEIRADDLVGNVDRHAAYEWSRDLNKLGKPVDRDEWHTTPQTINAYYNASQNEITFPAGILQPPFFNLAADDAVNYGGIGAVIGHEIGHGFDDQGSKWDGTGNLVVWWTAEDRKEFDKRGAALAAQYDACEPFPGFKVNGRFTLGENIGDLAGLSIAYRAYRLSLGAQEAPVIDGFTGDQRFFIGWAQVWRRKHREADLKNRLITDPHSPAEYRVNGIVRNVPAFYEAFGVTERDKLYLAPERRVTIW